MLLVSSYHRILLIVVSQLEPARPAIPSETVLVEPWGEKNFTAVNAPMVNENNHPNVPTLELTIPPTGN
jgi:hypothetical protein